jgi:hypothetical protein
VTAAIAPITTTSGSSISEITFYCVVVALVFGTLAVWKSASKAVH